MSQKLQVLSSVQALVVISAMSSGAALAAAKESDPGSDSLEEIIVTAERREEPLQKTPVAVTAISTEALEQRSIVNLDEVDRYLPNVNIAYGRGTTNEAFIFIRGIGQANDTGGADPGVGEYVDDVYLGRIQGGLFNLNDIASIEVLRGPQGTLYGKNTIGGAVTVNSNMPGPEPEYQADVAYGNYHYTKAGAVVSQPLTDALFLRISANTVQNDGFMANADGPRTNKIDVSTGRIVLRALPSDTSELVLSLDGSIDKSGPQNGRLVAACQSRDDASFWLDHRSHRQSCALCDRARPESLTREGRSTRSRTPHCRRAIPNSLPGVSPYVEPGISVGLPSSPSRHTALFTRSSITT